MAVDGAGNCYVTGWFQLTCDFDPDPVGVEERTTNGGGDMFLAKYDTDGNLVWVRTWGSVYEDYGQAVALDGSGNVYVTGAFYRSIADIDFDPGPGTDYHNAVGSYDVCLSKFDSDGNFLWAWTWGGVGEDWAYGIAATATGDVFVTGPFLESVDFNPDPVEQDIYNAGSDFDNVFVTKYNTAGVYQWTRVWDGGGRDNGRAAATDAAGNVYIVGDYGAPFNIGSFLRKYSPGGVLQYGYTWGSTDSDFAYGVATDGLGYLYVTGSFRYTVDFDPSGKTAFATSVGMEDIYLVKFSEGGVFQWVCSWGSWLYDEGLCVAADHSGNAYTSGYYYAETDFDPGPGVDIHTNVNWRDAFLSKILPQGSW
jgi:hypothetical protein